jgi:putative transposase
MPRALRILPAGSIVHARNRGNDRKCLFDNPREYELFLEFVAWAKLQCAIRIIAYCLMPNHWHFCLWPASNHAVEEFMHLLETKHAVRRRISTGTVGNGHIYQDRYKASIVDSETYYWNVMSYVEGNALRSSLVKVAEQWRWSSLYERQGRPRGILDDGPFVLPENWVQVVNQSLPDATVAEIRSELWKQRRIFTRAQPLCF